LIGDKSEATDVKMKQEAFDRGLWFGVAIGAIGTGLVVRFLLFTKRR
jgi:hypothetical protein